MLRLALALVLAASTAAYAQTQAPLSPGRPAGVKQSAIIPVATENAIILGGAALLVIGVAVYMARHGSTATTPAAATTTSP